MNLKSKDYSSESDESLQMSDYKIAVSKKQSTIKYSSSKSSSSDESLTDMIRKRRLQINKNVYAKEEQIDQIDATFDLSETLKNGNESTLESRIKKLEQELNTSLKSTQQRNYCKDESASLTSVDSFSIDYKHYEESQPRVNYYNNRLESIRSKNSEPTVEWKKGRKIEEFDFEISNLQQELESLKDSIQKEETEQNKKKVKLRHQLKQHTSTSSDADEHESEYREHVYDLPVQRHQSQSKKNISSSKKSSHHSNQKSDPNLFKKKSRIEEDVFEDELEEKGEQHQEEVKLKSLQKQLSILKDENESSDHLSDEDGEIPKGGRENNNLITNVSKKQGALQHLPISAIELNQKPGTDVSLDVVPQKQQSKTSGHILTENQQPNILALPSKTSLQCDVSRLYKLNKEVEVLKQIEKIRTKLKKSINLKLNTEKVIEQYDPSFTMQSKTKSVNKSGKLHCPNCTYLLNKGLSSAYCHCNK